MIERDLSAIMRGVAPVLKEQIAAISARLVREAEQSEALRHAEHRALLAEHRAWMVEQREAAAALLRQVEERLASIRNGSDGKDGAPGKDGVDGPVGPQGEPGRDGADGNDGAPGRDGNDGQPGKDGIDGAPGRDGADGKDGLPGEQGVQGAPGANGQDGREGVDGKDAYPGEARGLFDPAATYRALDVVSFNGCEWRAKRDDPGELPGDGWMLSASRGKRGDRGERGPTGKDGASLIALYPSDDGTQIVLTKDNGEETVFDVERLVRTIRSA